MATFKQRLIKTVVSGTPKIKEYTPVDGERVELSRFLSSGIFCSPDVKAEILWDGVLIYAAHGSFEEWHNGEVLESLVGNNTKKLTLKLTNDSSGDETMQVCCYGENYGS